MRFEVAGLFFLGIGSFFFTLLMLQVLEVRKGHDPTSIRGNSLLTARKIVPSNSVQNSYLKKHYDNTLKHQHYIPTVQYTSKLEPNLIGKTENNSSQNSPLSTIVQQMKSFSLPKHFEMKAPQSVLAKYIEYKRLAGQAKRIELTRSVNNGPFKSAEPMTAWEKEQVSRTKKLQSVCKETSQVHHHMDIKTLSENPHLLKNILVDDKNRLLFCYIPKVACTQWKRVMLNLTGITTTPLTIPHFETHNLAFQLSMNKPSFSAEDVKKRLIAYKSIVFSRHPLERIFSAYRDKFEQNTTSSKIFIELHGKQMLNKIKRNMTYLEKSKVMSLTFKDMLEFLAVNPPSVNQEHWKPAYHLCHPCTINYTYLGRFDDLFVDSTEILSRVLGPHKVQFPAVRPSLTSKLLIQYLSDVPASVEHQFRKVFRLDYDLFGYH
ncbi:Sulfotransferase [Trinorchestia longiramus]|nr:Sulfotransferase [Trinorchestia longiramus]